MNFTFERYFKIIENVTIAGVRLTELRFVTAVSKRLFPILQNVIFLIYFADISIL